MKTFRRNANHGDGMAVHFYLLAHDGCIAVETLFPVFITEHHNIFSAALFRFRAVDQPSGGGLEAEGLKKVCAHIAINDRLNFALMLHAREAEGVSDDIRKSIGLTANVMKVGKRKLAERVGRALGAPVENNKAFSVGHR